MELSAVDEIDAKLTRNFLFCFCSDGAPTIRQRMLTMSADKNFSLSKVKTEDCLAEPSAARKKKDTNKDKENTRNTACTSGRAL